MWTCECTHIIIDAHKLVTLIRVSHVIVHVLYGSIRSQLSTTLHNHNSSQSFQAVKFLRKNNVTTDGIPGNIMLAARNYLLLVDIQ